MPWVHHLKLPVTDLGQSLQWYRTRLGCEIELDFVEQGSLMAYALIHPRGGPRLALRLDPQRAIAAVGFDYFCLGVPDNPAIVSLGGQPAFQ